MKVKLHSGSGCDRLSFIEFHPLKKMNELQKVSENAYYQRN